jgi:hypothetical protein
MKILWLFGLSVLLTPVVTHADQPIAVIGTYSGTFTGVISFWYSTYTYDSDPHAGDVLDGSYILTVFSVGQQKNGTIEAFEGDGIATLFPFPSPNDTWGPRLNTVISSTENSISASNDWLTSAGDETGRWGFSLHSDPSGNWSGTYSYLANRYDYISRQYVITRNFDFTITSATAPFLPEPACTGLLALATFGASVRRKSHRWPV